MSPRARRLALLIPAVVALLFAGRWAAGLAADRWWAARISPYAARVVTDWGLLSLVLESTGIVMACCWFVGHLLLIYRAIGSVQVHRRLANLEIREAVNMQVLAWISIAGGLLLGFIAGRGAGDWAAQVVLSWGGRSYGEVDPLLGHDLGFYLTRLPLWRLVHGYVLLLVLLAFGGAATLYTVIGAIRWQDRRPAINDHARLHLGLLAALLALVLTWGYLLEPAELVAGVNGTVHTGLFEFHQTVAHLLTGVALATCLLSFWWALRGRHTVLLGIWGLLIVSSVLGHHIIPGLIGGTASALDPATRRHLDELAYGMTAIRDSTFARVDDPPDAPRPIAIWGPGLAVEATTADSGRPVAADRAVVTIGRRPRASWIVVRDQSPRGASISVLLDDQTGTAGLPLVFHEADSLRTRAGTPPLRLSHRGLWPGRRDPVLDTLGTGVVVGTGLRRLALAWALQSGGVLGPATGPQRAFWHLDPTLRLARLAPYAVWGTPVPRIIGGELVWLVDGYLASETFPGSSRVRWRDREIGSLRAGFVGVVGAETGATSIYLRHTADELAKAWQGIFEGLIKPASEMPAEVARTLPYPVELLEVQVRALQQPHWGLGQAVGRAESVTQAGPAEDARWEPDTSGVEQVIPFERAQQRQISAVAQARVADGWETLSILRIDSILSLPSPTVLQTRWTRFPTFQQLKDSVEKAGARLDPGPVHYWPTTQGLGGYQVWFASREGQEPAAAWVSIAITDRRGAGHDLEEAWQNLLGLTAPIISAGERGALLLQARRQLEAAEAALKRGDFEAFGRAWEQLKRTLSAQ